MTADLHLTHGAASTLDLEIYAQNQSTVAL